MDDAESEFVARAIGAEIGKDQLRSATLALR
jgi:hypothetical protein